MHARPASNPSVDFGFKPTETSAARNGLREAWVVFTKAVKAHAAPADATFDEVPEAK